jgi:hypothetical protein
MSVRGLRAWMIAVGYALVGLVVLLSASAQAAVTHEYLPNRP